MRIDLTLCVPRDTAAIGVVRHVASGALAELGVCSECIRDIALALSEACANAVEHARDAGDYEVSLELADRVCQITLADTGLDADASMPAGPMPGPDHLRGRGVALMHALVDDVEVVRAPSGSTELHLVKHIALRHGSPLASRPVG